MDWTLRFGEFADPAAERAYQASSNDRQVRVLRRNLIGVMVYYMLPTLLDFFMLPIGMVLTAFLPMRVAMVGLMLTIVLIPVTQDRTVLRNRLVKTLNICFVLTSIFAAIAIKSSGTTLTVSFYIVIIVMVNYLFLPTHWRWMTGFGVVSSLVYTLGIMPYMGVEFRLIFSAVTIHMLANVVGALTALELANLRRREFARIVDLENGHTALESANAELRRTEAVVAEQRDRLAQQVRELREAQERLLQAQDSLVQAEKMASLGQMVAGVAHELNTPIGVAYTAATYLKDNTGQMLEAIEGGSLTKSRLLTGLKTADETAALIGVNLHRAADLVSSFKRVAVDQSSEERNVFDLATCIAGILASLAPRLKREPHNVTVDCPDGIVLDSYPGALTQIIINIVINALVHAFPQGAAGTIAITAEQVGPDTVRIVFADDGKGIPPELQKRIFDPFFTTNRAGGGSGLGLHIVFNLVTRGLGGEIDVESEPGRGTRFVLRIPRIAPTHPAAAG